MAMCSKSVAGAAMALLVVLAMALEAQAQCVSTIEMLPCQAAVTKAGVEPTTTCCQKVQAALAVANGPACLCAAMTSPTAKAANVIPAEAVKLPSKCSALMGLNYIKGYNCNGNIVP